MKHLFILGRNPKLSIAEIKSYFEKINNPILDIKKNKNAILVEVENKFEKGIIEKFGGVISIGKIISSGKLNKVIEDLDNKILYFGKENKLNYYLWDFSINSSSDEISSYLKKRFKSEKLKATKKKNSGEMILQNKSRVPVLSSKKLIGEEFFLFGVNDVEYFGRIIEKCDYNKLEKRDMNKPVRRAELSISPRLAKIMINLSKIKKGGKLLDCFCGVGVILQEALLQEIKVIGVDKDKNVINDAGKNLKWFGFKKEDYKLIDGDSTKINLGNFDCIATEPDFGEILKKIPTEKIAKKMVKRFENLMSFTLNNLGKNIGGRIVFTSPIIKTQKTRIFCDIQKILNKTKLKVIEGFPIQDFRENQVVGRLIFVLE